jgi:peptidoglycan/xylan/chitin deacetylase (PgdA/CDA1 family)
MRLFRPHLLSFLCYHEAFFRIKTSRKVLFLTFDDGPDPESTPVILDILDKMHVKAVFFCNGNVAEMYPELIEKIRQRVI